MKDEEKAIERELLRLRGRLLEENLRAIARQNEAWERGRLTAKALTLVQNRNKFTTADDPARPRPRQSAERRAPSAEQNKSPD